MSNTFVLFSIIILLNMQKPANLGLAILSSWCIIECGVGMFVAFRRHTNQKWFLCIFVVNGFLCIGIMIGYLAKGVKLSFANTVPIFLLQIADNTILSIIDENRLLAAAAAAIPLVHQDIHPPHNYNTYVPAVMASPANYRPVDRQDDIHLPRIENVPEVMV